MQTDSAVPFPPLECWRNNMEIPGRDKLFNFKIPHRICAAINRSSVRMKGYDVHACEWMLAHVPLNEKALCKHGNCVLH